MRSLIIQAPTGSGKTALTAAMIKSASQKGKTCWFNVHRRELIKQSMSAFRLIGSEFGVIASSFYADPFAKIQICSIPSLVRRMKYIPASRHPDLIVWDECHHISAGSWSKVMRMYPNAFHIGLTATPWRLDGSGLDDHFETIVRGPSVRWLIDEGYLSDYKMFAPSSPNLDGLHTRMGDFITSELEAAVDKPSITGSALREYQRHANGKRAIVFAVSIKHSKHIVEQFQKAGIPAVHLDGKTDRRERDDILQKYRKGSYKVLSNVELFSEGFDVPSVECAILLRPTQSLALYLQQVGRALRPSEGKERAIILDHASNAIRHGLPCEDREWSLAGRTKSRQTKTNTNLSVHICENCFAALPSTTRQCPYCHHVRQIQHREVEEHEGELQEIDKQQQFRKRMSEQAQAADFNSLVQLGKERNYKNPYKWAEHVYRARQRKRGKS